MDRPNGLVSEEELPLGGISGHSSLRFAFRGLRKDEEDDDAGNGKDENEAQNEEAELLLQFGRHLGRKDRGRTLPDDARF